MIFHQYGKVRAVFEPKQLDSLKFAANQFIGNEAIFQVLWMITEEDSSMFAGQYAMGVPKEWIKQTSTNDFMDGFAWVPEEDLRILEVLDPGLEI